MKLPALLLGTTTALIFSPVTRSTPRESANYRIGTESFEPGGGSFSPSYANHASIETIGGASAVTAVCRSRGARRDISQKPFKIAARLPGTGPAGFISTGVT